MSTEIARLNRAKADISSAITEKGVTVPSSTKLDGMAELIKGISGGGTSTEIVPVKIYWQSPADKNFVMEIQYFDYTVHQIVSLISEDLDPNKTGEFTVNIPLGVSFVTAVYDVGRGEVAAGNYIDALGTGYVKSIFVAQQSATYYWYTDPAFSEGEENSIVFGEYTPSGYSIYNYSNLGGLPDTAQAGQIVDTTGMEGYYITIEDVDGNKIP